MPACKRRQLHSISNCSGLLSQWCMCCPLKRLTSRFVHRLTSVSRGTERSSKTFFSSKQRFPVRYRSFAVTRAEHASLRARGSREGAMQQSLARKAKPKIVAQLHSKLLGKFRHAKVPIATIARSIATFARACKAENPVYRPQPSPQFAGGGRGNQACMAHSLSISCLRRYSRFVGLYSAMALVRLARKRA